MSVGEVRDLVSVGAIYCKMLHACELTSDVQRAEDWLTLADGFVARTNRIPDQRDLPDPLRPPRWAG